MGFLTQAAACLFWFLWASFFEWFIHRYIMHMRRFPLEQAFEGHTLLHHQIYRGETFQVHGPVRAQHVMLRMITFPSILLVHLPFFVAFERLTGLATLWGGVAACTLYYVAYEYLHYLMHVPRGHFVERFRWFQFIRSHHQLHHNHMRRNFNVLLPLADYCLGTLMTEEQWRTRATTRRRARGRIPGEASRR